MTRKEELIKKIMQVLQKNTSDKEEVELNVYAGVNGRKTEIEWICRDCQYVPDGIVVGYRYYAYHTFGSIRSISNEGLAKILRLLKSAF